MAQGVLEKLEPERWRLIVEHDDGAPEDVIERCLAMMFAEGPGPGPAHGHYTNMMDRSYRSVACGMFRTPSGELWVVQNFY